MDSRLVEILSEKRKQVSRLRKTGMLARRTFDASGTRDFRGAISRPDSISLIAEIKFASPITRITSRLSGVRVGSPDRSP